jgi:hypothetical protein
MEHLKVKIAAGTAALVAVIGGGVGIAATQLSPKAESDTIVADAAKQLGVDASKLDAALKQALENRVDAAVQSGRITAAQGAAMKERIASGEIPLVGLGRPGGGGGHHGFVDLATAASYLGLTENELRTSLQNGSTIAAVAKAKGKSVDGLISALVGAAKADLAQAVADGRLTEAQRTAIAADLEDRITDAVNAEFSFGFHGGPGTPPEAASLAPAA